jgi:hypothetical protein
VLPLGSSTWQMDGCPPDPDYRNARHPSPNSIYHIRYISQAVDIPASVLEVLSVAECSSSPKLVARCRTTPDISLCRGEQIIRPTRFALSTGVSCVRAFCLV